VHRRTGFAPDAIGKTGGVRSRASFLVLLSTGLLVGGLAVGAAIAGSRVALDGRDPRSAPAAAQPDVTDAPSPSALTRAHDSFDGDRGARRADVAILAAALLLVAGWAWWITHRRRRAGVVSHLPLASQSRAPPRIPALACT
jgi:hypothetical protein